MLKISNLTKLYNILIGVNDMSVDLPKGAYGLLGPNGSGKTTLLNLITGQLKPTVGQVEGLAYRGHKIELLAEKSCFEEVAYLLLYDKLPNQKELDDYKQLLKNQRDLPDSLKLVLQKIPSSANPMDVMRTGTSMLGNLEPEGEFSNQCCTWSRYQGGTTI